MSASENSSLGSTFSTPRFLSCCAWAGWARKPLSSEAGIFLLDPFTAVSLTETTTSDRSSAVALMDSTLAFRISSELTRDKKNTNNKNGGKSKEF